MTENKNDKPIFGAAYILGGVFFIAVMAAFAKFLGETYHPVELVFYRSCIVLLIISVYFSVQNKWNIIKTKRLKSHFGRAVVGTIGIVVGFMALNALPLADATTLNFTTALFVVILSYPLLKEKVGPYKILAVVVGFLGVIIIADPSGDIKVTGISLGLISAFFTALVQIYLRDLGKTEDPLCTVFYFMLFGMIITAIFLPFVWTGPKLEDLVFILGLCFAAGLQQFLKARGHALAPVALTSPLSYTELLWATIFGALFWDILPTWSVLLGAAIIISSNTLILWREQVKKRS